MSWGGDTSSGSMIPPPPSTPTKPKRKPLHPRASLGIALIVAGIVLAATGGIVYAGLDRDGYSADNPAFAYVLIGLGGWLLLAGTIIFAASPARVDWEPSEEFWRQWQQGEH